MNALIRLVFVLSSIASVWGDEQKPLITYMSGIYTVHELVKDTHEAELEKLAQAFPKQHTKALLEYNLEKLKASYNQALAGCEDESHRASLEKSQLAWLEFYRADSKLAEWNAKGGSLQGVAAMQQQLYQVRMRIYQLSVPFLQGWQTVPNVVRTEAKRSPLKPAEQAVTPKFDRAGG